MLPLPRLKYDILTTQIENEIKDAEIGKAYISK
jgi:hypothetical protein